MAPPRNQKFEDAYGEEEAQRRTETALRAAFSTPHRTYEESKVGKRRHKRAASPGKRKAVNKSGG
jgi:hypothetical protein